MGVLVTTGRNPCGEARELCRSLASVLPLAACENRGNKTIEGVVSRARLYGKKRVAVISCGNGKVSGMSFAKVTGSSWEWLGAPAGIRGVRFNGAPKAAACCAEFTGARAGEWRALLESGDRLAECGCPGDGACLAVVCGEKSVSFVLSGKKVGPELALE
ncbi:MAG: hypothetical protein PHF51_00845 [Candidatus ainarchaeum sp.]|nr:hypothetical protein [Candidatus ainarchaeum sp.]